MTMARGQVTARRIFVGSSLIALTADRQNCGGCTEMIRDDAETAAQRTVTLAKLESVRSTQRFPGRLSH
jgi:hypothetical protein